MKKTDYNYCRKVICFFVTGLLMHSGQSVFAQNVTIKLNDGNTLTKQLSQIKKITHASGQLVITDTDNNSESFPLGNIYRLTHSEIITASAESAGSAVTRVYPNPASESINVEFQVAEPGKSTIEILNNRGVILDTQTLISTDKTVSTTVKTSGYAPGIYHLRITTSGKTITEKIIIN